MKKALLVLAVCLPLAAMFAVSLPADRIKPVDNSWELTSLQTPDEFELIRDDANPCNFGFKMSIGDKMGVFFSVPNRPFEITEACYAPIGWADDPDNWDAQCYLVFFKADSASGPTTELGRKQVAATEQGNWNWFDVSDLNITISTGNFMFAVENKVDDNPGMILDGAQPMHHVSWMYAVFQGT